MLQYKPVRDSPLPLPPLPVFFVSVFRYRFCNLKSATTSHTTNRLRAPLGGQDSQPQQQVDNKKNPQ